MTEREALKQIAGFTLSQFMGPHDMALACVDIARKALAQPEQEPVNKYCCHVCFNKSGQMFLNRMILCPECGNKRCPKATHHELPCTKSNEPNQAGSIYTTLPQRTWVGLTDDEIDQGLLRSDYAFKTAEAWRAGVVFAMTKLKEKNNG